MPNSIGAVPLRSGARTAPSPRGTVGVRPAATRRRTGRPALPDLELGVAVGGDLARPGHEAVEAAEVDRQHPGLALDVAAVVPGVAGGGREHRAHRRGLDLGAPLVLGLGHDLDVGAAVGGQVVEEVGDPADLQLDVGRVGGEHADAAGPDDHEHVRVVGHREAHEGPRPVGPVVAQEAAVVAADVDAGEGARHGVEAGGEDQHVELLQAALGAHALGHDLDDGVLAQVDEGDVLAVEGLEVAVVEHRALAPDRVVLRAQRVGDVGVGHRAAHHLAEQLDRHLVGVEVLGRVAPQARGAEAVLGQGGLALVGRAGEDVPVGVGDGEDRRPRGVGRGERRGVLRGAHLAVAGLDLGLLLGAERSVLRRPGEGGGALEHGEVAGDLGQLGDGLHARRAVADDADAAALELDALLGPEAALHDLAGEGVEAGPVGAVGRRQPAGRHHAEAGAQLLAGLGVDDPGVGGLVEGHGGDAGLEADVAAQVVAVGDVVEVALDLGLGGEVLAPLPLLLELRVEPERVLEARDVAARAGVAVPVPGAAHARRPLEHHHAEAALAQHLQGVEAGHAGPHDDDVRVERDVVGAHLVPPGSPEPDELRASAAPVAQRDQAGRRSLRAVAFSRRILRVSSASKALSSRT